MVGRGNTHELQKDHRYTALACFLWQAYRDTIDYIIDTYFKLMTRVYAHANHQLDTAMHQQRRQLKSAQAVLNSIGEVILDPEVPDAELRQVLFSKVSREMLKDCISDAQPWIKGKYSHIFNLVLDRFSYLRQFTPVFFEHLHFDAESEQA